MVIEKVSPDSLSWGETSEWITYSEFIGTLTVGFNGVTEGWAAWQIDFQRACPGKEDSSEWSVAILQLEEPISSQSRGQI